MSVLANWVEALQTTNLSSEAEPDFVSRWLILTRASVLPMTFFSAAIGGLLAATSGQASPGLWLLCTLGLLLAHASNNLMNDYFDLQSGVDTPDYTRAQYAPHPVLSGMLTKQGLIRAAAGVTVVAALIGVALVLARGWTALGFALAGFGLSFFYVAPPLRLKHHGLGEPAVFLVWGPLMVVGTYFITTGQHPLWVWWASLPYALLVTTVLFGKHIDKLEIDSSKGIHTLPVMLGATRARRVAQGLIVAFYASVVIEVLLGILGVWTLAVLACIPRARQVFRTYSEDRPSEQPENFPIWPLWYVAWAFMLTRQAGALLVGGLIVNALWPLHL